MTGMETASTMPSMRSGSLMRATPPCARMSAGTRSSAITATAPASSAIFAWSAVTTSMMTPPLSISAMPRLTRLVPCSMGVSEDAGERRHRTHDEDDEAQAEVEGALTLPGEEEDQPAEQRAVGDPVERRVEEG